MKTFRADLHIHTVLSPCGALEMSPETIINRAKAANLDLIAITDHNTTRQVEVIKRLGRKEGIEVLYGAEITTKEEVHCVALLPDAAAAEHLQAYLDEHRIKIKNKPDLFGYQVAVNEKEEIIYEEEHLLIASLTRNIYEVCTKVHQLGGLFIPAHIDRPVYGLIKMLGFIPDDLEADAMELSFGVKDTDEFKLKHPSLNNYPIVRSSDAHHPEIIGRICTTFSAETPTFSELKRALRGIDGRLIL